MRHSIFGWSYPPGCSGPPDDDSGPCDVCGQSVDSDMCICPECPECGEHGNPDCYKEHGLVRTNEQIELKEEADAMEQEAIEDENAFWDNYDDIEY